MFCNKFSVNWQDTTFYENNNGKSNLSLSLFDKCIFSSFFWSEIKSKSSTWRLMNIFERKKGKNAYAMQCNLESKFNHTRRLSTIRAERWQYQQRQNDWPLFKTGTKTDEASYKKVFWGSMAVFCESMLLKTFKRRPGLIKISLGIKIMILWRLK